MNFRTYEDLNNTIYEGISKIPLDIDLIVGIPRSGMLPANIIALNRNIPFVDIESFLNGNIYKSGVTRKSEKWIQNIEEAKKILVVDDSISSGNSFKDAKLRIENTLNLDAKIYYCAIYALPTNFRSIDIFFQVCNHPRMFEWNYMHHYLLEEACVDIDGVLCDDPGFFQDDDDLKYENFLKDAKIRFLPTKKIKTLVTCRLEKYRKQTEEWLEKMV